MRTVQIYEPQPDTSDRPIDQACCRATESYRYQCRHKAKTPPDADGLRWCGLHSPAHFAKMGAAQQQRDAAWREQFDAKARTFDRNFRRLRFGDAAEALLRAMKAEDGREDWGRYDDQIDAALALLGEALP